MTAAEFKALFPEFDGASNTLVESRIAWAEARTPADVWGADYRDQGIAFLTAHFLALLPQAKALRKGETPGATMYLTERQRLARIVGSAYAGRVAGLPATPTDSSLVDPLYV